ncbi:4-hydroxyphenylpyruvate dioxygenase, partial [Bacteriovoracaceae bacterium]|nr:4-hydroxyphenylpyruvate dioxygenase [Bacteriovoracaceae bacterium]
MPENMGIRKYDYIEFYVGSAKMAAYWYAKALGMKVVAQLGPETGIRSHCSYYLELADLKIVVTSPLQPTSHQHAFLNRHGDGVKAFSFQVDDVGKAFQFATKNGAIPLSDPKKEEDEMGYIEEAILKVYDDTEIRLFNRDNYKGLFRPHFGEPQQKINTESVPTGILHIDHIVGNVRINEMDHWADYYNKSFDFETFVDFKAGDIGTKYSALLSKVVRAKNNTIKNPINEPYEGVRKSQIEEYIDQYHGSGVQHIAIATTNLLDSIGALRKNGVEFLAIPDTYYDEMRRKNIGINESIDDLQKLGILVDFEGDGYLLQLFTKPIGDRPTFFFEFIQRVG